MGLSIWQILIVVLLLVLLFGRGKISELMGDMAKGIKSFKKGMAEDEDEPKVTHERADTRHVSTSEPIDVTPTRAAEPAERPADETQQPEQRRRDSA